LKRGRGDINFQMSIVDCQETLFDNFPLSLTIDNFMVSLGDVRPLATAFF